MNGLSLLVLHWIVPKVYMHFKDISAQDVLCAVMLCSSEFVHQFLFVARSGVCLYRDVHFHCVAVYFVCMLCKCLKFYLFCTLS